MTALHALLSTTIVVTPLIGLIIMLVPWLNKKFSPQGRYHLWILIMVGLALPLLAFIHRPALQLEISILPLIPQHRLPTPNINMEIMLLVVWIAGFILSLVYHVWGHFIFVRFIKRWRATKSVSPELANLFQNELERLDISETVHLEYVRGIKSPTLVGIFNTTILLPHTCQNLDDLRLILRHELIHFKRKDLVYKLALMFIRCLHWFNPAVHHMIKQANKDIELTCDNMTIKGMPLESRVRYSEIILNIASGTGLNRQSQLTTGFFGGKNTLKQRFANILSTSKKGFKHGFMLTGAGVLTIASLVGFNFNANAQEPVLYTIEFTAPTSFNPPVMTATELTESTFNVALNQLSDEELSRRVLLYWQTNRNIEQGTREELAYRLHSSGVRNIQGASTQALARQLFDLTSFRRLNDHDLASQIIFGHVDINTYPVIIQELIARLSNFESIENTGDIAMLELAARLFEWDLLATNLAKTAERYGEVWRNPGTEYWQAGYNTMLYRLSAHEELNSQHKRLNIRELALRIAQHEPPNINELTGVAVAFSASDLQDRLILMYIWGSL